VPNFALASLKDPRKLQVLIDLLIQFSLARTLFIHYKGRLKGGDVKIHLLMTRTEIQEFKRFLHVRNIFTMFSDNYRQNHLSVNPPTLDAYLEKVRADNVIPLAFVYPKSIYGKDWNRMLSEQRVGRSESQQLESLDLEIIDIKTKSSCLGLPKNTCSLSLRGGKRLTLNMEHSKMVAKKLSTHMLLTRSRQTQDVVLMFNRVRGIEVKFKPGSSGLQFNNAELANRLIELLNLNPEKEYFQIGIEVLAETKDYLLFMLKK